MIGLIFLLAGSYQFRRPKLRLLRDTGWIDPSSSGTSSQAESLFAKVAGGVLILASLFFLHARIFWAEILADEQLVLSLSSGAESIEHTEQRSGRARFSGIVSPYVTNRCVPMLHLLHKAIR
jgi:hypothetical protein